MLFVCVDGVERNRPIVEDEREHRLRPAGHVLEWYEERDVSAERFATMAAGAEGLLFYGGAGRLTAPILDLLPNLQVISYLGTGAARVVDLEAASDREIVVCNVPDYASDSIAEHTIALMLSVARRISEGDRLMRGGGWVRFEGLELRGRVLGVLGAGPIAQQVIWRARALGMRVICWTRNPDPSRAEQLAVRFTGLEELFSTADVISVHVAHTPETEGLISAALVSRMKPSAIFINTARAELVDNAAVFDRLRAGTLFGAGLDVFDVEPPPEGALPFDVSNLIVSPHVASITQATFGVALRLGIDNLVEYANGRPRNVVA